MKQKFREIVISEFDGRYYDKKSKKEIKVVEAIGKPVIVKINYPNELEKNLNSLLNNAGLSKEFYKEFNLAFIIGGILKIDEYREGFMDQYNHGIERYHPLQFYKLIES